MALTNRCGVSNSSPYCVCTDYYGNILPEYKFFDEATQTYSCCTDLVEYANLSNPGNIDDNGNNLVQFAIDSNSFCANGFYNNVATNGELKESYPLIYYQTLLNAGLFNTFSTAPVFTSNNNQNKIRCASGVPYVVSYPNYSSSDMNYKILCGSSDTNNLKDVEFAKYSNIKVPYNVHYILDSDGENCVTSECTPKYSVTKHNEYNIGDKIYSSEGTIESESLLLKWWFWFIILIVIGTVSVLFYYLYYHGMNKHFDVSANYLNDVKPGLGDTAKIHAKKKQKAHFHLNA